tara:strand:+ start:3068 stop:4816 length:1749 start_codon:yes stop_codon:yes gene_type:complete
MNTNNHLQGFLIQKLTELCYNRSLDSYRAKYLNPLQSIKELYELIHDWELNKIKDFRTLEMSKMELIQFLREEDQLVFESVSKKKLTIDLKGINKETKDFELIEYQLYTIQIENKEYLKILIEKLDNELSDVKMDSKELIMQMIRVDRLINYLITEAISLNFSKSYLYKLIQAIFKYDTNKNFQYQYNQFKMVLLEYKQEKYSTIFKIKSTESQLRNIIVPEFLNEIDAKIIGPNPKKQIVNYVKPMPGIRFIVFESRAIDYYQALKNAKSELSKLLDKIHIGYSNLKLQLNDTAVLINDSNKEKGDIQPLYYQIDGYYKSNEEQFNTFLSYLSKIEKSEEIMYEVKDRITSALRHLRLGNEAIEIEKKFINYWIGLEFIFSNYHKNTSTFARLVQYFPIIHSVYYTKRNCLFFHETIKKTNLPDKIEGFGEDILYFSKTITFETIIEESKDISPLLRFRAQRLKSHLTNSSDKRKEYLKNHKDNVEIHLYRLYRLRNKIVHDAAMIDNLESLTGNLRYYLSFTLNKSIEYFVKCDSKPIASKKIGMDDFFVHHLMIWDSLEKDGFPLEKLLKLEFSMDFLS